MPFVSKETIVCLNGQKTSENIVSLNDIKTPETIECLNNKKVLKKSKKKRKAENGAVSASSEPCEKTNQKKTPQTTMCLKENEMPKRAKQKSKIERGAVSSSSEPCTKTKKQPQKPSPQKPLEQLAEITIFDVDRLLPPVLERVPNSKMSNCKMSVPIHTKGSKYNLLYNAMVSSIKNLSEGYECLQSFRKAEMYEKSKSNPACTKGFSIGDVKFVMRKQFNKIPAEDAITPMRFASVVTVAADKVFREKLAPNPAAMQIAYETVINTFGKVHGFSVKCVPETNDQKKLFYYYLVTTISMSTLMEVNPISCMAIAKWRLEGNNYSRLGLDNKALDIDETYARCLSDIRATTKYVIKTKSANLKFKPDDVIDNKVMLEKVMEEFAFLKRCAAMPFTKRACGGKFKK